MSVEVHVHTRGSLKPDPELDPVLAIFYFIHHDWPRPDGAAGPNTRLGVIAIDIHNCGFTSFVGKPTNQGTTTSTKGATATPTTTPTKGTNLLPLKVENGIPSKVSLKEILFTKTFM